VWRQFSDFKRLIPQLFDNPSEAVVPVSVVLTVPAAQRDPALEADLMHQLQSFIAGLDLERHASWPHFRATLIRIQAMPPPHRRA